MISRQDAELPALVADRKHMADDALAEGRMTPDVYRATLFQLGWRGDSIETEYQLNRQFQQMGEVVSTFISGLGAGWP